MMWHSPIGRRTEKVCVDEVLIFKLHPPFATNRDNGCFKATHSWKAHKSISKMVELHFAELNIHGGHIFKCDVSRFELSHKEEQSNSDGIGL